MEFRPQDIAQLVLGYLKEVRCKTAFHELLNNMEYLQEHAENYRKNHYIITRVAGLGLVDYLHEYAAIYTIVQERLEASEYYRHNPLRSSLVKQILYLLDSIDVQSRASTPIPYINTYKRITSDNIISKNSSNDKDHSCESTHSHLDKVSISTTPTNRPHHSDKESSTKQNRLNKSIETTTPTADKSTSTDNEIDSKEKTHEKCEEIFTHTFLENAELIEKLANNINEEVSSKSTVELDNSAIDSIVQRTEADPILIQLMAELIDPPNSEEVNAITEEPNISENNLSEATSSKKNTHTTPTDQTTKRKLRSAKAHKSDTKNTLIEDQNKDAIDSIIAASTDQKGLESSSSDKSVLNETTEFMISTLQSCNINQSTYTASTNLNSMYTNTGNLLMIQPSSNVSNTPVLPQKTFTLDSSKSCYIIGSSPFVNVTIPSTPLKITNVLSEQDILAMPTLLVCDNNQQYLNPQAMVLSSNGNAMEKSKYQPIAPKTQIDKSQSISEYITLYRGNEPSPYKISSPKSHVLEKKPISNQTSSNETVGIQNLQSTAVENKNNKDGLKSNILNNEIVGACGIEENQHETSPVNTENKEKLHWSASKNNSHIRQLNFSSPEKWVAPSKNIKSSSKALKNSEKPIKVKKTTSNKSVRTTLFKSPTSTLDVILDNGSKDGNELNPGGKTSNTSLEQPNITKKLEPSWDANLRGFQVSTSPLKNNSDRSSKRKRLEDSTSETNNSKKVKESKTTTNDSSLLSEDGHDDDSKTPDGLDIKPTTSGTSKNRKSQKRTVKSKPRKTPISKKKSKKKKSSEVTPNKDSADIKEGETKCSIDAEDIKNESQVEKEYIMMNRSVKPRVNQKCNMENVKKCPALDEVILTNVPKIKSCEVLGEGESTLFLSTKLNTNKETAIEQDSRIVVQQNLLLKCSNMDFRNPKPSENSKEEECKAVVDQLPRCYSLPMLQTPIKNDHLLVPKTPCPLMSTTIDTPFTKAVIDQLTEVDINSIQTPKFPITPSFAFTPAIRQSPFSNRGTDYSTSSSYYQPSDSEQNKSLEQLIQECQMLEKQEINEHLDEKEESLTGTPETSVTDNLEKPIQKENDSEIQETSKLYLNEESEAKISKMLVEKRKAFNQNMLGQKNMQLVKMLADAEADQESSDSNTSKNSSTSSSDEDSGSSDCSCANSPLKKSPYSLRPRRTTSCTAPINLNVAPKKVEETTIRKTDKSSSFQGDVLQKMEEIRQRTIAKIKNNSKTIVKPKPVSKLRRKSVKTSLVEQVSKTPIQKKNVIKHPVACAEQNLSNSVLLTGEPKNLKSPSEENCVSKNGAEATVVSNESNIVSSKETKTTIQETHNIVDKNEQPNDLEDKNTHKLKVSIENSTSEKVSNNSDHQVKEKSPTTETSTELLKQENKPICESKGAAILEDEDIVLHLSSEEENLEPLEIVETELTECPPAPILENSKGATDVNIQMKIEDETTLDNEAESLVKGLKQWGIHLIPNKLVKNAPVIPECTPNKPIKSNKTITLGKPTVPLELDATTSTNDKFTVPLDLDASTSIKDKPTQPLDLDASTSIKDKPTLPLDLDVTLEEGEIRSPIKKDKTRSDSKKRTHTSKDRKNSLKDAKPRSSNKSSTLSKKKEIPALNKILTNSTKESVENTEKRQTFLEEPKNKEQDDIVVEKTNFDVQFDIKTYEKETLLLTHDYSSKSTRKLSDYNFEILNKKFAANVYIDEIESEVEKLLTFTRFNIILDLPTGNNNCEYKKSTNTESKTTLKRKKMAPLNALYNALSKKEENIHTPSPLENLYSPASPRERKISRNVDKIDRVNYEQSEKHKKDKSNHSYTDGNPKINNPSDRKHNKSDRGESHILNDKLKKLGNKDEKLEKHKDKKLHKSEKTKKTSETSVNSLDPVKQSEPPNEDLPDDNSIQRNICSLQPSERLFDKNNVDEEEGLIKGSEDDLMNYAAIGSERVNNDEFYFLSDKRKRKTSVDNLDENQEDKRKKTENCHDLLQSIDVDSFLKHLHGDQ